MQNEVRERAPIAEILRRTSAARAVGVSSVRYFSNNVAEMGWRDRLLLPVVAVMLLALVLVAPETLSEDSFAEMSQHAPVTGY
ncbi:hypothetical protein [Halorussus sp. MSC15.2]|uniref:hypothetical protein n=1 Tax=Halorussus sp. MSC15.2 TaxID=2283638 RepID=UPI0013D7B68A|nr:hypothetical protein [Halorussus sp. MSC15.2]NEU56951.1 hypothetical protein [Halorussus sp. MSC15.2]